MATLMDEPRTAQAGADTGILAGGSVGVKGSMLLAHTEGVEKRREGRRHPVGAIRESPLHQGLYPSFLFVYTMQAGVSTQHAADAPPAPFGPGVSILSYANLRVTSACGRLSWRHCGRSSPCAFWCFLISMPISTR